MKKILTTCWLFVRRNVMLAVQMLVKPNSAWSVASTIDKGVIARFVCFFAILCAVVKLFGFWLLDGSTFPIAVLAACFRALSLWAAWWLSLRWLPQLMAFFFKIEMPARETALLTAFGLTPVFAVYLVLAFTSASFLYFLAFYNYIIVYDGFGALFRFDEKQRSRLSLAVAAWLFLLPLAIEKLLCLLVPNAPL